MTQPETHQPAARPLPHHEHARRRALVTTLAGEVGAAQARALAARALSAAHGEVGDDAEAARYAAACAAQEAAGQRLEEVLGELTGRPGAPAPPLPLPARLRAWGVEALPPGEVGGFTQHVASFASAKGERQYDALAWVHRVLRARGGPPALIDEVATARAALAKEIPDADDCRRCACDVFNRMDPSAHRDRVGVAVEVLGPTGTAPPDAATLAIVMEHLRAAAYPIGEVGALAQALQGHLSRLHRDATLG